MNKGGMDISTLAGIGIGFGAIIMGYLIEGGNPAGLVGISAIIMIFGGTVGATMTSFTIKDVMRIPKLIGDATQLSKGPSSDLVETIITFAEKARREGILSLEGDIDDIGNPLLKKGVKLLVDGTDPEIVRNILENDIYIFEIRRKEEMEIFAVAGGYSPTMGIIGTVTGLILVLSRLGGDSAELGHSIAVAFIATLYGIGLANLFWLPIASKLKLKMKLEKLEKEMIIVAVLSLMQGENPSVMRDKLDPFLEEGHKEKKGGGAAEEK
jgi:chemotaxis protein MotA